LFVLGFSFVFVFLGGLAHTLGSAFPVARDVLTVFGGLCIIAFGFFMLRFVRSAVFEKERRIVIPVALRRFGTPAMAVLFGAVFAVGWTPCVGPVVATVLFLVSSSDTFLAGMLPLLAFLVGFAVPFLAIAYGAEKIVHALTKRPRVLLWIERIGGVLLIVVGILVLFGEYHAIAGYIGEVARTLGWEAFIERWL
jgi:cytochrome c-type biogenesis protein